VGVAAGVAVGFGRGGGSTSSGSRVRFGVEGGNGAGVGAIFGFGRGVGDGLGRGTGRMSSRAFRNNFFFSSSVNWARSDDREAETEANNITKRTSLFRISSRTLTDELSCSSRAPIEVHERSCKSVKNEESLGDFAPDSCAPGFGGAA
jgi:hypothetical protein